MYVIYTGHPSITLRHRLICEIRSSKKISLMAKFDTDTCELDPDINGPPPPHRRPLCKFPTKILTPTEDLKTKMLVRDILFHLIP